MSEEQGHQGLRLATVREIPHIPGYQSFTCSALRHLIYKAKKRKNAKGELVEGNGLTEMGAVIRVGRRVYIDLDRFDEWLARHREANDQGVNS